jgi:eukaryotic-like serine/threonine-protein kinase
MMSKLLGDRYLLGAMIGTGGMADVYTAQDQRLSREVAVKILRSDLAQDPIICFAL